MAIWDRFRKKPGKTVPKPKTNSERENTAKIPVKNTPLKKNKSSKKKVSKKPVTKKKAAKVKKSANKKASNKISKNNKIKKNKVSKAKTVKKNVTKKRTVKKRSTKKTAVNKNKVVKKKTTATKKKPAKSTMAKKVSKNSSKKSKKAPKQSGKIKIDMAAIRGEISNKIKTGSVEPHHAEAFEERSTAKELAKHINGKNKKKIKGRTKTYIKTGVPGCDELFEHGVPHGSAIILAGGAGSGKTIFSLHVLAEHASRGHKCFYMSFEESEDRLIQHMNDFGWDAQDLIKKGNLKIKRYSPFEITRNVDAMLAKEKGELMIDLEPIIIPKSFKPDIIALDSLTAVASAFTGKEDSYRIYIEQLFRFFEKLGSTSFLITETKQIPDVFSTTGVEEFLADGVFVFYNSRRGDIRERAFEVLKLRGESHEKKIVAMEVTKKGIIIYPDQEVFSGLD